MAGFAAIGTAVAAVFYSSDSEDGLQGVLSEEIPIKWNMDEYRSGSPPEPRFNIYDNDECRAQVLEFYESASGSYTNTLEQEAMMDDRAQKLLDMMAENKFTFVNNMQFY